MNLQAGEARRLLAIQSLLTIGVGVIFFLIGGFFEARSALYGGACALVIAWLLSRTTRLALKAARVAPGTETTVLYLGALQRFITVLALFALGIGWLKLDPIPLIIAFAVAQGAFYLPRSAANAPSDSRLGAEK